MQLTSYLADQVPNQIQTRGNEYFRAGTVTIVYCDRNDVEAIVRGTEPYRVGLERVGPNIFGRCTCAYFTENLEICKHVWAALRASEQKDCLQGNGKPPRYLDAADDGDGEWDDDDLDDEPPRPTLRSAGRTPKAAGPSRPGTTDWKRALADLRSAMVKKDVASRPPVSAGQEVVYVVDVAATLAGNGLVVDVATRAVKMNGEWSKPKRQSFERHAIGGLPDAADRQILATLSGAREQATPYGYYGYSYTQGTGSRFLLGAALQSALVPPLCATGRSFLRLSDPDETLVPLRWDDGGPWEFWLRIAEATSAKRYTVSGELRRGEERLALDAPHLLVAGGLVFWDERVAPLHDQGAFPWISLLRQEREVVVPTNQKDSLLAELFRLPNVPRLDVPEDLRVEEVSLAPQPRLKIKRGQEQRWSRRETPWLSGELSFEYDGQSVAASDPARTIYEPARRRLILRDRDAERAANARLEQVGFHARDNYGERLLPELAPRNLPKVVRTLLAEGWRVEAEGKLYRQPGEFNIQVTSGIDWFEVHGGASFGDQEVQLPELLAALRRGDQLVPLGDGTVGMVPEDWLKKYGMLGDLGTADGDHLRFNRTQVGLLDALLAERPEVTFDARFEKARDQLRQFQGVTPAEPPAGFRGELRAYQREGLGWLHFLREFGFGGCLADDMGLGKTVQVLALLDARRECRRKARKRNRPAPSLAVVPRSVVFNWKQEADRFTPELRVLDHTGVGRAKPGPHFDDYDLILTTYGTLRRDIAELAERRFDYAILDEAQAIKNAGSQSAKAARLIQADHRLAMSGTPIENHLGELWSLFEFLNPGMLGHAAVLRLSEGGLRNPSEEGRAVLAKALRPFLLRRTKGQVAKDLPEKTEQTLYCDLEPAQRRLYDELRTHYQKALLPRIDREGMKKSKIQILEALLRLRQAACHPALIDKKSPGPSAKLDALMPQLQELFDEGHKTLVFSQFTSLLALVRKQLDADKIPYEYLDGRTRDRAGRVERFQNDPDCKLFLISLKAGGLGLNLTAADYVYLLDPWWNPAVESQAIDRAHRIGQTRPVFAYRIIARDTVEEKVLQLQEHKRTLADAIITADNSVIRDLGREDLELLLS